MAEPEVIALEDEESLPQRTKKKRSPIWNYFSNYAANPTKAVCAVCGGKYQHSNNTSNLDKHLKVHTAVYEKYMKEKAAMDKEMSEKKRSKLERPQQITLQSLQERRQPYPDSSDCKRKIDEALLDMIVCDMQPASVVDDKGFGKLLHVLDPRYVPPSRRTIMRSLLPKREEEVRARILHELEGIEACSLTSDFWSSRNSKSFITVTCHFIDNHWQLKSYVLATHHVEVSHTAENIAHELKQITSEWNILDKITVVVSDSAANMKAGVRLAGFKHLPCFAHTLNLVVNTAIRQDNALSTLQSKCRNIVTFFKQSNVASNKLSELQREMKGDEIKLIQDVVTRWNSTYYMFTRLVEEHNVVTAALCFMDRSDLILTSSDIAIIKDALQLLAPFEEATREMSADKFICVSEIIPLARSLQLVISKSTSTRPLRLELIEQMRQRFANMEDNHLLAASTTLDPRFKKLGFSDPNMYKQAVQRLTTEVGTVTEEEPPTPSNSTAIADPLPRTSTGLWDVIDERVAASRLTTSTVSSMVILRSYLDHANVARNISPLSWWYDVSKSYMKLVPFAKKYLAIPGTSVPSERLFSKAGELISTKRSSLKPKHVNLILFLNKAN